MEENLKQYILWILLILIIIFIGYIMYNLGYSAGFEDGKLSVTLVENAPI